MDGAGFGAHFDVLGVIENEGRDDVHVRGGQKASKGPGL